MVNAKAQAGYADKLMSRLSTEELDVYKAGRNAKVNSVPKNAEVAAITRLTGLEASFGYLYLKNRTERITSCLKLLLCRKGFSLSDRGLKCHLMHYASAPCWLNSKQPLSARGLTNTAAGKGCFFCFFKNGKQRRQCQAVNLRRNRQREDEPDLGIARKSDTPPMLCMLLRKHLTGARIKEIRQPDMERLYDIAFAAYDELGGSNDKRLVLEMLGRAPT
jgi:hypothetical protein